MNILVTGSDGFVGSHLVSALEADGHEVSGLDITTGGDITARLSVERVFSRVLPERVYHCAAVPYWVGERDPYRDLRVNLVGSLNIFRFAHEFDARVLYTSTSSVYGNTDGQATEDDPLDPITNYGVSKAAAELYARRYARRGLDVRITRFSSVYGPGTYGVANAFLDRARDGQPLEVYGSGEQTRDFIHVDDAVRGLRLVMEAETVMPGEAFNIGTGVETSINDLAEVVSDLTGVGITHAEHKHEAADLERNALDISKIREVGAYDPSIGLRAGIRRMVNTT